MLVSTRQLTRVFAAAVLTVILAIGLALPALAAETIRLFDSDVTLHTDGSVDVVETIAVNAEGYEIRRGIFRDIPTVLRLDDGRQIRSSLEVVEVRRNGASEPYEMESIERGVRIRIGDADVYLRNGVHTYTLHYTMTRVGRAYNDADEIFWNATGNYWDFPIERATAKITLPEGAVIARTAGYTGAFGSTERAVATIKTADNVVEFQATRRLAEREGLSVAVGFQKGILDEPDTSTKALYFISDNRELFVPLAVFLVLFGYYMRAWLRVGRDPAKGTIIPLFYPPEGFSPGLTHYVANMGWSGWQAFTAALVSLAVKGLINIETMGKKTTFISTGIAHKEAVPSAGETVILNFIAHRGSVTVDKATGPQLASLRGDFTSAVELENRESYFRNNVGETALGIVMSLAGLGIMLLTGAIAFEWLLLTLLVSVFIGGLLAMLVNLGSAGSWPNTLIRVALAAIAGYLFVIALQNGDFIEVLLASIHDLLPGFVVSVIVVMSIIFASIMRAPTVQGRKVMDQIEGFRMYLETAEKERLNMVGEPELTPARFEAILPYAIALGVEKPWADHFEKELQRHADAGRKSDYQPHWYHGRNFSSASIGRDLAGISSGMSAAMIAAQPVSSSSSGSSGGGSSGGGSGGGGGGGW